MEPNTSKAASPVTYRLHRPGDMGIIVHRHAVIYCEHYGWDERFEAMVARIVADFLDNYDPAKERCWIAERCGEFLGCVMVVKDIGSENTARLRCLIVEPSARGLGLGTSLVWKCIDFAKDTGYQRLVLSTESILEGARRIYKNLDFKLVREEKEGSWGTMSSKETWELALVQEPKADVVSESHA